MKRPLILDIQKPLHEVERGWIRKPVTIFLGLICFIPAFILAFCIGMRKCLFELKWYFRAIQDTWKGSRNV